MGLGLLKKIIFTLLLLPALVYLTRIGIADFLRLEPCAYVEAIQKGRMRVDPAELIRSRERLLLAHTWDAGNPIIPEYLGQIAFIRAQLISLSPTVQALFLREAIEHFDSAIALRPNSAHLWAARMSAGSFLLETKERLGVASVDDEFSVTRQALLRAAELGPWEPSVLQQIAGVGNLRYREFSLEERGVIDGVAVRAKRLRLGILSKNTGF